MVGRFFGPGQVHMDTVDQAGVAREAEEEVDPVGLAPGHQRFPGEAPIGANQDLHPGPALTYAGDYPGGRFHGSGAGVDVRLPQLGREQVIAAEHVKRQIAVAVVVAVEQATLLRPMPRIVRGVEIKRDARRRASVSVEEQILDGARIMADPPVTVRAGGGRVLQTVQGAFARQRRAAWVTRLESAQNGPRRGVVAQRIMVDHVLVAERDPEHPLADQRGQVVHDAPRRPTVLEAGCEPLHQADRLVRRPQQQRARV